MADLMEIDLTSSLRRMERTTQCRDQRSNPALNEAKVPCFTPDCGIATPGGRRLVRDLQVGDRVITRDNGLQEIRWIGTHPMTQIALLSDPSLNPVRIRAGALGNGVPECDMLVSPEHRILVANAQVSEDFSEGEFFVPAKDLASNAGINIVGAVSTTYTHVMFDQHEVVLSDGVWTESFQADGPSLKGVGSVQRAEILKLFPRLESRHATRDYPAARRCLAELEVGPKLGKCLVA